MRNLLLVGLLSGVGAQAQQVIPAGADTTNTINIKISKSSYYREPRVVHIRTAVAMRALLSSDTQRSVYLVILLSNRDVDLCTIADLPAIQAVPPIPPPPPLGADSDFILSLRIDDGEDAKNGGAETTRLFKQFFSTAPPDSTVPSAALWAGTMTEDAVIGAVGRLFPNERVRVLEPNGRQSRLAVGPRRAEGSSSRLVWSRFIATGFFHVTAKGTKESPQYQEAAPRDGYVLISRAGDAARVQWSFAGRELTAAGTVNARLCPQIVSHTWKF